MTDPRRLNRARACFERAAEALEHQVPRHDLALLYAVVGVVHLLRTSAPATALALVERLLSAEKS